MAQAPAPAADNPALPTNRTTAMDPVSRTAAAASSADLGTVQGSASLLVLRKAIDLQAASAAQLIEALPQATLATSGPIGTRLDTYA